MKRKIIDFKKIRIPEAFQKTHPSEQKLASCQELYSRGIYDREIVVNHNNVLVDGYVLYLVAKENGYDDVIGVSVLKEKEERDYFKKKEARGKLSPTMVEAYILGKHWDGGKEYCWKVPGSKLCQIDSQTIGKQAVVNTQYGNMVVTVTGIIGNNQCNGCKVRKVVRFL